LGIQLISRQPSLQLVILEHGVHNGDIPVDVSGRVSIVKNTAVSLLNAPHGASLL
jgi:hypothetical protein